MTDEHPRRRSLESLRKEAKRWLAALRSDDDDARARLARAIPDPPSAPTLRDVQHALAVEQGFPGWAALKERLAGDAAAGAATLAQYAEKADALLAAYTTGTPEAMERHWRLTWHRRSWQGMRRYVQLDLGRRPDADAAITLDDARYLVAVEHGFESWDALVRQVASMPAGRPVAAKPVRLTSRGADGSERTLMSSRSWTDVIGALAEHEDAELDAQGQMTDAVLAEVAGVEHLTSLRLGGSKALTDAGVRHLARLPRLRHLDLGDTGITDRGLEVLRELPALETLSLRMTKVTDAGMAHLSACERLEDVALDWTRTGDGALRALAGKRHLHHLSTGNGVTDAGLAALHDLPVFREWQGGEPWMELLSDDARPNRLVLRGSFTDRGMEQLRGLDGLFALRLDARGGAVTGAGLAPLVSLANLGYLAFDAKDDAMPHIAAMPKLRFISCQDSPASDEGFLALSRSKTIEMIWAGDSHGLQRRGFLALSRMPALRALSVSCLNVDDVGLSALPEFPSLRELMPMGIPDDGFRHIARCERLEALTLMYCRDTTDAATEHIAALPELRRYFNSYTAITDRTPELLSRMDSLERITFDRCPNLTNVGVAALARLPRLRDLSVSGPGVTGAIVAAFPSRVRVNYVI